VNSAAADDKQQQEPEQQQRQQQQREEDEETLNLCASKNLALLIIKLQECQSLEGGDGHFQATCHTTCSRFLPTPPLWH